MFRIALIAALFPLPALAHDGASLAGAVLTNRSSDCADHVGLHQTPITDVSTGTDFVGRVEITATEESCTFTVNQIPNHDAGQGVNWPNRMGEVPDTFTVTRTPSAAAQPTALSLDPQVIFLNGVQWEANPAACFGVGNSPLGRERIGCGPRLGDHPWRYNVGSSLNDGFRFDDYHAHVQASGKYHYHSTPRVLYTATPDFEAALACEDGPSPVIGFAADGFPVYGPCFEDETGTVRPALSGYVLRDGTRQPVEGYPQTPYAVGDVKSDDYDGQFVGDFRHDPDVGDLDACNGMTVDGQYAYYVTAGFPYTLRCLTGTPDASFE